MTSARPSAARFWVPTKMTSSIFAERTTRGPCAPSTQATASTTLDLPEPFGPTTTVIPGSSSIVVGSAKDLKPFIVSERKCITSTLYGWGRNHWQCRGAFASRLAAARVLVGSGLFSADISGRNTSTGRSLSAADRPTTARARQSLAVIGGVLFLIRAVTTGDVEVTSVFQRRSLRGDRRPSTWWIEATRRATSVRFSDSVRRSGESRAAKQISSA